MPVYLHYSPEDKMGHKIIVGLDSDGFGHPLYLGDIIDGKEVDAIVEIDDKIGVIFK